MLEEHDARQIAAVVAAGIQQLHDKNITLGILNPWLIKLDRYGVLYFDLLWCVVKQFKHAGVRCFDSRLRQYLGSIV